MFRIFLIALSFLFHAGSISAGSIPFPEDLMFLGAPIHPKCIIATQWGDSSRFELKPIEYFENMATFDPLTNWVWSVEEHPPFTDYSSYCYIGPYAGGHLIYAEFYDTSGTGRFNTLGVIKRVGNNLKALN